ncbi:polysaccharide pyruvyl transferase family protein [Thiobacillus sp.]|uniref:polysaccharide pyruvyl transferase family protein n=1 Tax=Thiobacillus sp. TaxID=924 RepID=UPI0025DFCEC5|nr:polysaccharide pyruvyl transferase family protein [Thiobacillus sp.]MBT9538649.1 polysaccharide pyruvyl transferase family protein [Thiobacillus sp.]
MRLKQVLIDQAIIARNFFEVSLPLYQLRTRPPAAPPQAVSRFLIIPGDASNPSGSLGDMAMYCALLRALRALHPNASFTIVGTHDHRIDVPGIGEIPVAAAWIGREGSVAFDALIRQHHALFVMGADILDGKYGAALVQRIVAYCNHSVRLGIPATTLGFSFNRNPRWPTLHALSRLHPKVTVNVRDQPSLTRFTQMTGTSATLCADVAFLMPPASEPEPEAEAWIAAMRAAGRNPVGVNLNAHALAPTLTEIGTDALITHLAEQLHTAGETHQLAFLLIPHDLKLQAGDVAMLQAIEMQLHQNGFPHVRYTPIHRSDRIKRVVGQLDLVITGRMHLAIASLGCGTPILSITYQDKFEGLYEHVDLPLEHTLLPLDCLGNALSIKIGHAFRQRQANRERIRARLPQVQTLSARNLVIAGSDARHAEIGSVAPVTSKS